MKKTIIEILNKIEEMEDIEILYACEAGSCIWGFSNDDSDNDVRFIYKKSALSLKMISDVIEYSGDDFNIIGWHIKKAFNRENPNLREWLISDIVYIDNGISDIFKDLGDFDKDLLKNHYSSIAYNHWKTYSGLAFNKTKIKKYLYVLSAILCWNILNSDIYPPLNINKLIHHEKANISDIVKCDIEKLIDYYNDIGKIGEDNIFRLNNFILNSLNCMKNEN